MSPVRTALLSLAVLAGSWAAPATAQADLCENLQDRTLVAPGPERLEGAEPHVYKRVGDIELRLHVVRPEAASPSRPAVVIYSVGGWMFGKVGNSLPLARDLAACGMTVILPDIRTHCRDGVNIVDEVADANAAFRWVRAHAAELRIDPARIAAAGGSAGGHIALSTAMFPAVGMEDGAVGSRPDLLLLFFPCVDPTSEIEQQYSAPAIAGRGAEVSPLHHMRSGLPPMLILQGTDDPLNEDVNIFCAEVRVAGNLCDYAEYAGAKHGFFRPGNDHYDAAFARLAAFLADAGYIVPAG